MIEGIRRFATKRSLLVTAVAWLCLSSGNALLLARLRRATEALPILDLQPLISPNRLYSLLEAYGESGRRIYFEFTVLDMVYPVAAYALFGLVIVTLSAPLSARASACLLTLPVTGLVLELAEQIGFLLILAAFPRRLQGVAWFTTSLTALKLTLLAVLGLVVAALCIWRLLRRRRPTSPLGGRNQMSCWLLLLVLIGSPAHAELLLECTYQARVVSPPRGSEAHTAAVELVSLVSAGPGRLAQLPCCSSRAPSPPFAPGVHEHPKGARRSVLAEMAGDFAVWWLGRDLWILVTRRHAGCSVACRPTPTLQLAIHSTSQTAPYRLASDASASVEPQRRCDSQLSVDPLNDRTNAGADRR